MLTDLLTETCDAIEEYLVACPEAYAHCVAEVRAVYDAIVQLRRTLEQPCVALAEDPFMREEDDL